MKKCKFCNNTLIKRINEGNWGFNKRTHCNIICSSKGKKLLNLKYKTRKDKGIKRKSMGEKFKQQRIKIMKKMWEDVEYRRHMVNAHKGYIPSKETIEKRISKLPRGENHPNWKGGITPINEKIRKSREYKIWRKAIFERDNYTCVWCRKKSGKGVKVFLQADHIKPFALYPELRFALDNGRTLCKECHRRTDTYGRPKKQKKNNF